MCGGALLECGSRALGAESLGMCGGALLECGGRGAGVAAARGLGFFVLEGFDVEEGLAGAGKESGALVGSIGGDVEVHRLASGYELA